jgi:AcrR family transcriptional regulator
VLRVVRRQYLDGERVDLTVVSRELGLSRATIYRWFGSRDALLGEVIADELEQLVERERRRVRRRGAPGLLAIFDGINQTLARSSAVRRLLEQERNGAMRLLTASTGVVQPRAVELVRELIDAEVEAGTYEPPADATTLAYAIVRLAEAFLYNDAANGIRGDHERLRVVEAALLGVSVASAHHVPRRPTRGRRPGFHSAR